MSLLPETLWAQLRANDRARLEAAERGEWRPDPLPLVRLFNPVGSANWLATELNDEAVMFGLCDLGFGRPELCSFSLLAIEAVHLPFGMRIERDPKFRGLYPLSVYAEAARMAGSVVLAERLLREAEQRLTGGR